MIGATSFNAALRNSLQIGVIGNSVDPVIVESTAAIGFDFYTADLEHGVASDEMCAVFVRTCQLAGMHPLVRVAPFERARIARLLDAGAEGVLVPGVENHQQVLEVGQTVRFPPRGKRGMSATFVSRHGFIPTDQHFLDEQQSRVSIIVQIENTSALDDIGNIVGTGIADAVIIGERDLSISLGVPGETTHPRIAEAHVRVRDAAKAANIAVCALARTPQQAAGLADAGVRVVFVSLSSILMTGGGAFVAAIRPRQSTTGRQRQEVRS